MEMSISVFIVPQLLVETNLHGPTRLSRIHTLCGQLISRKLDFGRLKNKNRALPAVRARFKCLTILMRRFGRTFRRVTSKHLDREQSAGRDECTSKTLCYATVFQELSG